MKLIFLLFVFLTSSYASKILSYNIYDRTDRTDIMITFDTPFEDVIKQSTTPSQIILKLSGVSIESAKMKKTNSSFLHSIKIIPMENQTQIIANISKQTQLHISKTSDAYGLRLRFSKKKTLLPNTKVQESSLKTFTQSTLPTKKSDDLSTSYYIVVFILIIGIVILFVLKKKITNQNTKKETWLFQKNKQQLPIAESTSIENDSVSIRFQKKLDDDNSVVMLDFMDQSYLVMMGKSNILLDKFNDNKPATQEDFNSILQNRNEELENFLGKEKQQNEIHHENTTEALQSYKERAASMLYDA